MYLIFAIYVAAVIFGLCFAVFYGLSARKLSRLQGLEGWGLFAFAALFAAIGSVATIIGPTPYMIFCTGIVAVVVYFSVPPTRQAYALKDPPSSPSISRERFAWFWMGAIAVFVVYEMLVEKAWTYVIMGVLK